MPSRAGQSGAEGHAIPYLTAFTPRAVSIDSQASGVSAHRAAQWLGRRKSDAMVAHHMVEWLRKQQFPLHQPSRLLPVQSGVSPPPRPADRWQRAIEHARREIRDLIESRDLGHEQLTAP